MREMTCSSLRLASMALKIWSTGLNWQIHYMSASVLWTKGEGGRRRSLAS
jgi:hypothetical protein